MAPFFRPCWVLQAMPSNGIDTSSATVGLEKNQSLSPAMRLLRGPAAPVPMLHSPMLSLTCSWRCKAEKCAIPVNRLTIAIQVGFGFVTFSFWSGLLSSYSSEQPSMRLYRSRSCVTEPGVVPSQTSVANVIGSLCEPPPPYDALPTHLAQMPVTSMATDSAFEVDVEGCKPAVPALPAL